MRKHVGNQPARPVLVGAICFGVGGIGGVGVVGGAGCAPPDYPSGLEPAGPPVVLQVFMKERTNDGVGWGLAYGNHDEWQHELDPETRESDPDKPVLIEKAIVVAEEQKIRVVFDELLNPSTVEHFVCACASFDENEEVVTAGCGEVWYTHDAAKCPENPSTTTIQEAGRYYDPNNDGNADQVVLLEKLVSLECGSRLAWENSFFDGFYQVSGNQIPSLVQSWEALGPALIVFPPLLPTNTTCSLTISRTMTDKDGEPVTLRNVADVVSFPTEPLAITNQTGQTGIDPAQPITIKFTAPVKEAPAGSIVVQDKNKTNVPGSTKVSGANVVFTPSSRLANSTEHTVTIKGGTGGVKDTFDVEVPADMTFSFTTAAPAA
ncbi:MAG: Ig-like domain-containing protein [Pseudomonadota bacterium]